MLLEKVSIHKYKSFLTNQSFDVDKQVTRIVGKNESGKTALLEALAKSNYFDKSSNFEFNKKLDYPRSELSHIRNENPAVLTCEYRLQDEDIKFIEEEFAKGIVLSQVIVLKTYYDNTSQVTSLDVNFNVFKEWLISKNGENESERELILDSTSFEDLENIINNNLTSSCARDISCKLKRQKSNENNSINSIAEYIFSTCISKRLPKFWYFSDYYSLPSKVELEQFANEQPSSTLSLEEINILKALFELSGLQLSDIQSENEFEEFKAQLESTSNSITDSMFEYWSTNKNLSIRFEIQHQSKRFLNIRIYNSQHRVTLPLKNSSKGFIWFFSFLVWFSKIQGDRNTQYILLLDEPGLSLHATAQNDLLRFIDEKLAHNYQVIYTTHSPFMIDSQKLNQVRTVYDTQNPQIGSVVSDAIEEKDSDTLFPLQAALGYTIAQNLYISKKNLLVEGISDLIYLNSFSEMLKEQGREGLKDGITIVPVGGADKIATFISLMRGNNLSTVCLLDTFKDQRAQARLDKMVTQKIISNKKIVYYSTIINQDYADIEDLFKKDDYLTLYNGAFSKKVDIGQLKINKPILEQLRVVEKINTFNHYAPSYYMVNNMGNINFSLETLSNFEKLFSVVNTMFK